MSLIMAFLLPMVVLTIISVVFGSDWMGTTGGNFWTDLWDGFVEFCEFLGKLQGEQVPDTEGSTPDLPEDVFFEIDPVIGAIVILITIGIIGTALGIKIVGSGLSEWSIRLAILVTSYSGLWFLLTILAMPLINSIDVFGSITYIGLSIGFTIGVIQKIAEG